MHIESTHEFVDTLLRIKLDPDERFVAQSIKEGLSDRSYDEIAHMLLAIRHIKLGECDLSGGAGVAYEWWENVYPLLDALEILGIDPVEWVVECDFGHFIKDGTRELVDELTGVEPDQIFFACGYMQATGNLTGRTWAEQIAHYLPDMSRRRSKADGGTSN